jgi:hypothetical protein
MINCYSIRVTAQKLRWVRNGTCGVLGSSNLKVIAMDSNLLECKCLSCIFGCLEINERIVTVTANPNTDYWLVLKDPHVLAHLLQSTVEKLHELHVSEVLRDIPDV